MHHLAHVIYPPLSPNVHQKKISYFLNGSHKKINVTKLIIMVASEYISFGWENEYNDVFHQHENTCPLSAKCNNCFT